MPSDIPYISPEDIRDRAEALLREHHEEGSIPVPIEEIIEFDFDIEIRPMRALQARFKFEGALSHDLQTIFVDEEVMQRFPNRYRFTLAHELAHYELHGEFIRNIAKTFRVSTAVVERRLRSEHSFGKLA